MELLTGLHKKMCAVQKKFLVHRKDAAHYSSFPISVGGYYYGVSIVTGLMRLRRRAAVALELDSDSDAATHLEEDPLFSGLWFPDLQNKGLGTGSGLRAQNPFT